MSNPEYCYNPGNSTPDRMAHECSAATASANDTSMMSTDSGMGESPTSENVTVGDTSHVPEFSTAPDTSIVCREGDQPSSIDGMDARDVAEDTKLFLRFDSNTNVCDMSADVNMTPTSATSLVAGKSGPGPADLVADAHLNSNMSSMSLIGSPVMVQDDNEYHGTEVIESSAVACSQTSVGGGSGDASAELCALQETMQSNRDLNLTESGDYEHSSMLSNTNNGARSRVDEGRSQTVIVQPSESNAESSLGQMFDLNDFGAKKRRTKKKTEQISAGNETNPTDLVRKYFRSPFWFPAVDGVDIDNCSFKTVGNLQEFIDNTDSFVRNAKLDGVSYAHLLRILYHTSEGMHFLHARGFVLGCVRREQILLDRYLNARLSYCKLGSETAIPKDIENFGILMLYVLCWQKPQSQNNFVFDALVSELKEDHDYQYIETVYDQCVDKIMWCDKDVTLELLKLIIQCLNLSLDSCKLKRFLKTQIVSLSCRLPLITWPEQKCLYCCFEYMSDTDIKAFSRLSKCRTKCCPFLKMCLDCMRVVCCYPCDASPRFVCPEHGDIICSAIGGSAAYAYMIRSMYVPSTTNSRDYQETFDRDRERFRQILAHPRVFGIPRANVRESELNIPRGDGAVMEGQTYTNDMIDKIQEIANNRPNFFLLYYSGHHEPLEYFKKHLLEALNCLRQICPHILIILDCCYAHSLDLVPRFDNDEFMVWHIQWSSCKSCEQANVVLGEIHSLFTKYLMCALQGAYQCADGGFCSVCEEFQRSCEQQRCIMFHDLSEYVKTHMERKLKTLRGNSEQHPCFTCHGSSIKCPIAFFPRKRLFQLNYMPPLSSPSSSSLDDIGVFDHILCSLRKTSDLPRQLHHRALQVYGGPKSVDLNTVEDIVDSDFGNDLLWFKVRSNGSELDVGKMVAFEFTQPEAAHYEPQFGPIHNGTEASKVLHDACNLSGENIAPLRNGVVTELTRRQVQLLCKHMKCEVSTGFFKFLKDSCEKYRQLGTVKPLVVHIYTNLVLVYLKGDEI